LFGVVVKTVCIIYQSKFGGTNVLLSRLSCWFSTQGYDLIDSADAQINKSVIDYLILPTSEMHRIVFLKLQGVVVHRTIIWAMGHGAFKAAFFNEKIQKYNIKFFAKFLNKLSDRLLSSLIDNNAIVFTDYVGLDCDTKKIGGYQEYINLVIPIAISSPTSAHQHKNFDQDFPNVGWLGRIDVDFKVWSLIKLLLDIDKYNLQGLFRLRKFIIIGSGNADEYIRDLIPKLSFHVEWIKFVDNDKLEGFLFDNVDLMFAMGTSVLESAKIGIPSIIVQPCRDGETPSMDSYRWVYQSIGYSLGEFQVAGVKPEQLNVDFFSIVKALNELGYQYLSEHSFGYARSYYPDVVFPSFEKFMNLNSKPNFFGLTFCYIIIALFHTSKTIVKRIIKAVS
jgi:hypothetical protein